jgi:hypothetical protein
MPDLTAKRTLVKSPPELWSELSEVERLARHLDAFGEIKITKLEPEHTVAWEGESASGTVSIEPSGWGTRVTLTAQLGDGEEAPAAETAAGAGEGHLPAGRETQVAEPVVDVPVVEGVETRETGGSLGEDHVAEEPVVEEPVAEEPVLEEPDIEEAELREPVAEEPVTPPAAGPIPAKARRKRGFLAWLFRPRTSAQVSEPVDETPAIEEAPLIEEATIEEEACDPEEPSSSEEPVTPEEPPSSEQPQVNLFDGPMVAEPPAGFAESASVLHEARPVPGAAPEEPDLSAELAAAEQASPPPGLAPERAQAILDEALDALGSAHHRPYSRG